MLTIVSMNAVVLHVDQHWGMIVVGSSTMLQLPIVEISYWNGACMSSMTD